MLPMFVLAFKIINCLTPLQKIANTIFVLRGQRLIPSGTGKVWKPPPCVLSFHASCQLAASFPPTTSSFLPTQRRWLSLASLVHGVLTFCYFWEEDSWRERTAWFSGFLGTEDVFVHAFGKHWAVDGEMEKSEGRPLSYLHLLPENKIGQKATGKEVPYVRGRKRIILNGNWDKKRLKWGEWPGNSVF